MSLESDFKEGAWQILNQNGLGPDCGDPLGAINDLWTYISEELELTTTDFGE
jgi:hypothetical protein